MVNKDEQQQQEIEETLTWRNGTKNISPNPTTQSIQKDGKTLFDTLTIPSSSFTKTTKTTTEDDRPVPDWLLERWDTTGAELGSGKMFAIHEALCDADIVVAVTKDRSYVAKYRTGNPDDATIGYSMSKLYFLHDHSTNEDHEITHLITWNYNTTGRWKELDMKHCSRAYRCDEARA